MKRIFAVAAAIFTCAFVIGTGSAGAGELLDSGRIIAAMEDQYQGYNYRNTMDLDKFVAALEDNRSGDYRNTHTQDSYVASLQDNHEGYYRNTHTQDSYIASLQDNHSHSGIGQFIGTGKACQSSTHDDHIHLVHSLPIAERIALSAQRSKFKITNSLPTGRQANPK